MDVSFLTARRLKLLQIVENVDDVLLKLSLNPRQSYTIDTGQHKETVTAANTSQLRAFANGILADIQAIDDELNGSGDPTYMRPAF